MLGNVTANATVQATFRASLRDRAAQIFREPVVPPGTGYRIRLIFAGQVGQTYRVEYTDNLAASPVQWQVLAVEPADAMGEVQTMDPGPLPANRFYRAIEQ